MQLDFVLLAQLQLQLQLQRQRKRQHGNRISPPLLPDPKPLGSQPGANSLPMVPLNFNLLLGDRSTGPAMILDFGQQGFQLIAGWIEPADHGHQLATFPLFHCQLGRLFFWRQCLRLFRRALAVVFQFTASIASWRPIELRSFKQSHLITSQTGAMSRSDCTTR